MTSILKKKLNKKGFTLAELLVVVAIIAVLVAIAIPTFNAATTKAYKGVAEANARSAYADWMIEYISSDSGTLPSVGDKKTYSTGGKTTECEIKAVTKTATGDVNMTITAKVDGMTAGEDFTFSSATT